MFYKGLQKGEDHTRRKAGDTFFSPTVPPATPVSPVVFSAQSFTLFTISALYLPSFAYLDLLPVMLVSVSITRASFSFT